jgi:hypothetical protein
MDGNNANTTRKAFALDESDTTVLYCQVPGGEDRVTHAKPNVKSKDPEQSQCKRPKAVVFCIFLTPLVELEG